MSEDNMEEQPPTKRAAFGGRRLCAHADLDGEGTHWLEPGEECYLITAERLASQAAAETSEEDGYE
jgi:hypothetical protein